MSTSPPTTLGKYQIIREIARSNDIVYEGWDPAMNRRVALKELAIPGGSNSTQIEDRRKRFMREARAAGSLTHPNIVTIFEVAEDAGRHYIAMEYLDGRNLRNELESSGLVPRERACTIACEVLKGLSFAHSKGVVHRDIKPENIQLLESGAVKITDFGIARLTFEPNITMDGQVFGTPSYMSPEQINGKDLDARTDLFSVGVILLEMLGGQKPFQGDSVISITFAIMNKEPVMPASLAYPLVEVLEKALSKMPQFRYASADDMRRAIESANAACAGGSAGPWAGAPAAQTTQQGVRINPYLQPTSPPPNPYAQAPAPPFGVSPYSPYNPSPYGQQPSPPAQPYGHTQGGHQQGGHGQQGYGQAGYGQPQPGQIVQTPYTPYGTHMPPSGGSHVPGSASGQPYAPGQGSALPPGQPPGAPYQPTPYQPGSYMPYQPGGQPPPGMQVPIYYPPRPRPLFTVSEAAKSFLVKLVVAIALAALLIAAAIGLINSISSQGKGPAPARPGSQAAASAGSGGQSVSSSQPPVSGAPGAAEVPAGQTSQTGQVGEGPGVEALIAAAQAQASMASQEFVDSRRRTLWRQSLQTFQQAMEADPGRAGMTRRSGVEYYLTLARDLAARGERIRARQAVQQADGLAIGDQELVAVVRSWQDALGV